MLAPLQQLRSPPYPLPPRYPGISSRSRPKLSSDAPQAVVPLQCWVPQQLLARVVAPREFCGRMCNPPFWELHLKQIGFRQTYGKKSLDFEFPIEMWENDIQIMFNYFESIGLQKVFITCCKGWCLPTTSWSSLMEQNIYKLIIIILIQ